MHIYKEISHSDQGKFIVGFIIVCLLPCISLVADLMQIHPAINLPIWVYLLIFFLVFYVIFNSFYENFKILTSTPLENECKQLFSDKLVYNNKESYIVFTRSNNCIYPDCKGQIKISDPPERYNGDYAFWGKCDIAGKQHSYGIDCNFKAYPLKIDWRPIPDE